MEERNTTRSRNTAGGRGRTRPGGGTTVEQEIGEIERACECKLYGDLLRELHGLEQSPLEYILSLTEEEKRELVHMWKEYKKGETSNVNETDYE